MKGLTVASRWNQSPMTLPGSLGRLLRRLAFEKIHQQIRHHLNPNHQAFFINVEIRCVPLSDNSFLLIARPETEQKSRHDLLVKREIFRSHPLGNLEDIGFAYGAANGE